MRPAHPTASSVTAPAAVSQPPAAFGEIGKVNPWTISETAWSMRHTGWSGNGPDADAAVTPEPEAPPPPAAAPPVALPLAHKPQPKLRLSPASRDRQAPRPGAAPPLRSRWPERAAFAFFGVAVAMAAVAFLHRRSAAAPAMSAREPVQVFTLSRTQTITVAGASYALLGLGQDSTSGRQIVWIRDLRTNQVGGFATGDRLFGTKVMLSAIAPREIALRAGTKVVTVPVSL